MKLDYRQQLLASTLLVGVGMFASPAFAQTAAPVIADPVAAAADAAPTGTGADATNTTPNPEAQASSTNAKGQAVTSGDEIIVTGSRIPQPNLTSTSPVTVVTNAEVKLQGTTRVEDLLNSLPQVFASEGSTDANGASGIATVSLRGLGASRTLVLINGRRLVPGDPTDPVADLNFIPSSIIKRVDVLTGGASSVYGSDALAGVVNFVMDTGFTGIRIDAQASVYNHENRAPQQVIDAITRRNFPYPKGMVTDGGQQNITVSFGADFGEDRRGHVLGYAGYRKVSAITSGDRDFSSCGLSGALDGDSLVCSGSSTSATGRFRRTVLGGFAAGVPFYVPTGPNRTVDPNNPNGEFIPFVRSRDAFNFNPYNYFQRPDERYTFGAFADYEISSGFHPYMEAMFMDDRTLAQIAPSGAFFGTDFFTNCNNPLLSSAQSTFICGPAAGTGPTATGAGSPTLQSLYIGRRNVEGGPRIDDLRHTDYRVVAGLKGEIVKGVKYDGYFQVGRAILSEEYRNDFSRVRLNRALNVVADTRAGATPGSIACASVIDGTDPNCVPYDIFNPGGVTQGALNYLQTPGFRKGQTTEYVASGAITAALGEYGVQSPFASEGVGIAFGAEYRKEDLELRNDIEFLTGDLAGQGSPFGVNNAQGSINVKEVFAEARIPLASDRPFFHELNLELGYRHSKYNISGSTDAYKIAGEWAPSVDFKFRGGFNRSVRAPTVLDLFTPPTVGLFSSANGDPCAGPIDNPTAPLAQQTVNGNTLAQCALSGVTAANFGTIDPSPANQYNSRGSGNRNLVPEIGNSYTVGLVLTPRFIPRFTASIDGFDIKIKKVIGSFGADFSLQKCVSTGNPIFCNNVQRSPGSGSLFTGTGFVDNPGFNLGSLRTRGIDVNAGYRTPLGFLGGANLSFDYVGTYLDKYEVEQLPGALSVGKFDCAGFFGDSCGTPNPKYRHKLRTTVAFNKNISLSGAWRYFASVKNDLDSNNPLLNNGFGGAAANNLTPRIKAQSYFDLAATATFDHITWRLGAQNILDKSPPITPGYSNNASNVFAQVYDSLGRYLYSSVTLDF